MEKLLIKRVINNDDVACITLTGLPNASGVEYSVFSLLAHNKISVDIILESITHGNKKDLSFTVAANKLEQALRILKENASMLSISKIVHENDLSKVSVSSSEMLNHPGIASRLFDVLLREKIDILIVASSEINIALLINRDDAKRAVYAISEEFVSSNSFSFTTA